MDNQISPAPPGERNSSGRRARVIALALALSTMWVIADSLLGSDPSGGTLAGLARKVGSFVLLVGGLFIAAGLLAAFHRFWHTHMHGALARWGEALWSWTRARIPTRPPGPRAEHGLRSGERIALIAGLFLTMLDVVLTALLLRDVFPEAPYRFNPFGLLSPAAQDWAFYVTVASFKTLLEVWFGVFDRVRQAAGRGGQGLRWFVLGGASAFDAILAAARGLMLAEQGITGGPVMVSNVVFVGFGLAVPWVAAYTGGLLATALDPWLERFSLLRLLAALPAVILLVAVWGVVLAVALPVGAFLLALGILTAVWFAMEDVVAMLLGQDPSGPPRVPLVSEPPTEPSREGGAILVEGGLS